MKKNWLLIISLIMLLIGTGMIIFGVVYAPKRAIDNNKVKPSYYTVESDMDGFIMHYEFRLETSETLNVQNARLKITKVGKTETEVFDLVSKSVPNGDDKTYKFVVDLDPFDYLSLKAEEIDLEIYNLSGQKVNFEAKPNSFGLSTEIEEPNFVKLIPVIIGSFICFIGFILLMISIGNSLSKINKKDDKAEIVEVEQVEEKEETEDDACPYCGCIIIGETPKCTECGAPIKRK